MHFTCVSCGQDLSGQTIESLCPNCGTPVALTLSQAGRGTSGVAVASLVLGIISIIGCFAYGLVSIVCGPLAIYFGVKGQAQARDGTAAASSMGMARAGKICGIIGTCLGGLGVLFLVFVVVMQVFLVSTVP